MRIGIDISQIAYNNSGVANYLENLVKKLLELDRKNEYILFFASLRREFPISNFQFPNNVQVKKFKLPPTVLDFIWNRLHIFPIESFIGEVDFFITSDWTEPPVRKAKKVTIIYDLIVNKYPKETDQKIVSVQKRKLEWVKKESDIVFCISKSTKKDVEEILGIDSSKVKVIYAGVVE